MKLTTATRQEVYDCFAKVYKTATGISLDWKQGEKGRVKIIFTTISEAMGERDEENFQKVLICFMDYLIFGADKWLGWEQRSRGNYVGFLSNKDNIQIFVKGRNHSSKKTNIAGVKEKDGWDF